MSQLPTEMVSAVCELISHLTGFDQDEENFDLCLAFATSNLLYHKHFDPEEKTVYKWMDGLKEKLWVHVERDKVNQHFDIFRMIVLEIRDLNLGNWMI